MPSDSLDLRPIHLYRVEKPLKDAPFVGVLYDGETEYRVLLLEVGWRYRYQRHHAERHSSIDQLKPWRVDRIEAVLEGIGHVVFNQHNSNFKRCGPGAAETSGNHPMFEGYPWPRGREDGLLQVLKFRSEVFLQPTAERKYNAEELRWQCGFGDRVSEHDYEDRTWSLDQLDKVTERDWRHQRFWRKHEQ